MTSFKRFMRCYWVNLLVAMSTLTIINHGIAQVPIIQPGAPGLPGRVISAEEASNLASSQYSVGVQVSLLLMVKIRTTVVFTLEVLSAGLQGDSLSHRRSLLLSHRNSPRQ